MAGWGRGSGVGLGYAGSDQQWGGSGWAGAQGQVGILVGFGIGDPGLIPFRFREA